MPISARKQPIKFRDRITELGLVQQPLAQMSAGHPITKPVLYFYGVPMVGKTTLISELQRVVARDGFPAARIDFGSKIDNTWGYDGIEDKALLLLEIMRQLETQADAPALERILQQEPVETMAMKVLKQINRLNEGAFRRPVVLFFDTFEQASSEDYFWLQRVFIQPALEQSKVQIIFAARLPNQELGLDFSWPVRKKTIYHQLSPFGVEDTNQQFKDLGHASVPIDVYSATGGIPGINSLIAEEQNLSEVTDLLNKVVEKILVVNISNADESIKNLLFTMSSFRWFDDLVLAKVARHFWPDQYSATLREGTNLARKLQETTLVEADRDGYGGYIIARDLRALFDNYQLRGKPAHKLRTHEIGYSLFDERVMDGDFISLADVIYHVSEIWSIIDSQKELIVSDGLPIPVLSSDRETWLTQMVDRNLVRIEENPHNTTLVDKLLQIFVDTEFSKSINADFIKILTLKCQDFLETKSRSKEQ